MAEDEAHRVEIPAGTVIGSPRAQRCARVAVPERDSQPVTQVLRQGVWIGDSDAAEVLLHLRVRIALEMFSKNF